MGSLRQEKYPYSGQDQLFIGVHLGISGSKPFRDREEIRLIGGGAAAYGKVVRKRRGLDFVDPFLYFCK